LASAWQGFHTKPCGHTGSSIRSGTGIAIRQGICICQSVCTVSQGIRIRRRIRDHDAVRCSLDFDRIGAIEQAKKALPALAEKDRYWANLVFWVWDHRSATTTTSPPPNDASHWTRLPWQTPWWHRVVVPAYANQLAHLGDIAGAVSQCEILLQIPGATANVAQLQLAQIALMQFELAGAESHLDRIDHTASTNQPDFDLAVRLTRARIQHYRGRHMEAGGTLAAIGRDAMLCSRWNMLQAARLAQAELWLNLDQLDSARHWEMNEAPPADSSLTCRFGDICPQILVAKLRLKEGNLEAARHLLVDLIEQFRKQSHLSLLPDAYLTLAHTCSQLDARKEAVSALELALEHGGAGNIRLPFLATDFDLLPLLHRTDRSSLSTSYVNGLIRSLQARVAQPQGPVLTAREREILELVSEGQINKEIAQQLYVSEYTIKNHLVNIGRKLSTGTRSAAVDRARQLGLLQHGGDTPYPAPNRRPGLPEGEKGFASQAPAG